MGLFFVQIQLKTVLTILLMVQLQVADIKNRLNTQEIYAYNVNRLPIVRAKPAVNGAFLV